MIGEKIKIGFDGTAVKRGLGGIMGGFGKLKRGIGGATRQVGIGMARGAGMSLFGTVMRGVTAIPNQIKELSNLRQEFYALGDATGAPVDGLLALRQAISKTSNISADLAGKSLKKMTVKIGEAIEFGSRGHLGLSAMGIQREEIESLKDPIEQMRLLADGYQRLRKLDGINVANAKIRDLMGSSMGEQLTPLLWNFEDAMKRGYRETASFAGNLNDASKALDGFDDIGRAFDILFANSSLGFLNLLENIGINMGEIARMVEGLDFTKQFKGIGAFLKREYDEFNAYLDKGDLGGYLMGKLQQIGKWITDMIAKGISGGIDLAMQNPKIASLLNMFMGDDGKPKSKLSLLTGGLFGGDKKAADAVNKLSDFDKKDMVDTTKLEDIGSKTNALLSNMNPTAVWG